MDVYVVFKHSHQDYPNENTIVCICLNENKAKERVEDEERAQDKAKPNKKYEFWYEDHELDIGNMTLIKNNDDLVIIG